MKTKIDRHNQVSDSESRHTIGYTWLKRASKCTSHIHIQRDVQTLYYLPLNQVVPEIIASISDIVIVVIIKMEAVSMSFASSSQLLPKLVLASLLPTFVMFSLLIYSYISA